MILTTTPTVEGHRVESYLGVVASEVIAGANVARDFLAGITDLVGGRSAAFEGRLTQARDEAMTELQQNAAKLGADAVVGLHVDYEVVGQSMLMVTMYGTAVRLAKL